MKLEDDVLKNIPLRTDQEFEPAEDYPPDLFNEEDSLKRPPESIPIGRGDDCCLMWLWARQTNWLPNETTVLPGGRVLANEFRRQIYFGTGVNDPAKASKIKVIQYVRNDTITSAPNNTTLPFVDKRPLDKPWAWTNGADGWRVDSIDSARCWPDYNKQTAKHGVRRRAIWISWYDNPGMPRRYFDEQLASGSLKPGVFPLIISMELKTDILCTDENICVDEHNASQSIQALWQSAVIGSVTWRFQAGIQAIRHSGGYRAVALAKDVKIDQINIKVHKKCPGFVETVR